MANATASSIWTSMPSVPSTPLAWGLLLPALLLSVCLTLYRWRLRKKKEEADWKAWAATAKIPLPSSPPLSQSPRPDRPPPLLPVASDDATGLARSPRPPARPEDLSPELKEELSPVAHRTRNQTRRHLRRGSH